MWMNLVPHYRDTRQEWLSVDDDKLLNTFIYLYKIKSKKVLQKNKEAGDRDGGRWERTA